MTFQLGRWILPLATRRPLHRWHPNNPLRHQHGDDVAEVADAFGKGPGSSSPTDPPYTPPPRPPPYWQGGGRGESSVLEVAR